MRWVTRKGVRFDRTACAWLILRFIDPDAEFGFLTPEEMPAAIDAGARAFHNYTWTGNPADVPPDRVNFPRLLADSHLDGDQALVLFGDAIRNAERSGRSGDESIHYGLWAIFHGVHTLSHGDDAEIVQRLLPVYDALYAYCKLRAAGQPLATEG